MVISMAVILIPLLLAVWLFTTPGETKVEAVEVSPVLATARQQAPYPVLAPVDLPEGWTPTRVRWAQTGEPWLDNLPSPANAWQLGYISPDGTYVAIQQRDGAADAFVTTVTREGDAGASSEISGYTWTRYTSADDRTRSLVAQVGASTAIVTGDTSFAALEEFVSKLTEEA